MAASGYLGSVDDPACGEGNSRPETLGQKGQMMPWWGWVLSAIGLGGVGLIILAIHDMLALPPMNQRDALSSGSPTPYALGGDKPVGAGTGEKKI
jgi:hypothetical protein